MRKLTAWVVWTSMLLGTPIEAQTRSPRTPQAANQKPVQLSSSTDWNAQIQKYQALLNDVDIASDPDAKHAVYLKWVDATCQSKRAKVLEAIGDSDISLANTVYSTCVKRLQAQESSDGMAGATGEAANPTIPADNPPSITIPNVTLPQGCSSVPRLNDDFKTDTLLQFPTPSTAAWSPDPKWVQLNANSSGGEVSTKSTVWLGYINRLRYNVTLGGVVTPIAAPTIPNGIFPTTTPASASQPAPNKPAPKAGPLHGIQSVFDSFNTCFQTISTTVVAFQSRLANEELLINDARDRIENNINSLQPIVNTLEEARAAADRSILPQNEIPTFPMGDVTQLRGLLTEFISKYAQFAQWASDGGWNESEFQRVSTGAAATAQALDKYLASPSAPNTNGSSTTNDSATRNGSGTGTSNSDSGGTTRNGTSPATRAPAGTARGNNSVAASQGANSKKPGAKAKNSNAGQSGIGNATTGGAGGAGSGSGGGSGTGSGQATDANAGTVAGNGTTQQAPSPAAIDVGSTEVRNYEANREYINRWSDAFRRVAVAPAGYFVATYKPQCGGWFGQGTSTQMQITVLDATNPTQNPTPRNLDKVVCQSALTVTNGLGLSFIPDRTPAFVPSTNSGANGSPVLGFSSDARVRPAYALQVNAALWSPRESRFEVHWALGAMLTAVTGGATTDIFTGPSFSFRKRAFFISPIYDLGQRTVFQNGFIVGTPQGVLTSPPTRQTWKSGFGLTITFPLSPGSSTVNSSNSTGNSGAGSTGGATGTSNSKSGNKASDGSGSNPGSGD